LDVLQGKIAVLTGAASGIGLEVAREAARLGMRLMLVDIQREPLQAVVDELRAAGADVDQRCMDVSKEAELVALADQCEARFGVPHLLFNNAGIALGGLLWEHTAKDWQWALDVNLMSIAHAIRVFVPRMLKEADRDPSYEARIINTASMAGLLVTPNLGAYTVTKHAVVALSQQLYHDLKIVSDQVGASVLCPYFVPTGIHDSARYRPEDLDDHEPLTVSKQMAAAAGEKSVKSGTVSADYIAKILFDAVREKRYYIFSHPSLLRPVRMRMDDIVHARNPSDPFILKPGLRKQMREALKAGEPPAAG
jgi:NAD(P)-dependent dehydrogenase (short-subunit alcohol dehydrogenase family)